MRHLFWFLLLLFLIPQDAHAQASVAVNCWNPIGTQANNNQWVPCPVGAEITGAGTGSTGAVVATLAASTTKTTYICGFTVSAIGGTATVGPITVAGTTGSSLVWYVASTVAGSNLNVNFNACIPGSAVNTAITVTTTADGTATAVTVNAWGFQR